MKLISTHSRTLNIQKNVVFSFILRGGSIGISLVMVPLTLNYLDQERYGLWLTLSSIINWFVLFDIGLGNGFRNKFAEALAKKDDSLAKTYVSTTFVLLSIIIACVLAVFFAVNPFLDWGRILNTTVESPRTLSLLAIIIFSFFAMRFVFQLVSMVFLADQKSALVDLVGLAGSLLSLIIILLLMQIGERSLLYLGLALSASPVFVLVLAYLFAFSGRYAKYKPAIKYIDFKQSRNLMGLGIKFFIIQICGLLIFSTSNVIITQLFSPSEVAVYNIAFKYFSVVTLFFSIVLSPCWSAYTEAFMKQDFAWIRSMIRKLIMLWALFCLGTLVMVILSKPVYRLWVGSAIDIPIGVTIGMAIYVSVFNWNSIFAQFIAGVGKVYFHVFIASFGGIVFIPLAIFISRIIGLPGISLAMILAVILGSFLHPIQYIKLIHGKAKGIWSK